jgi:predicted KAP-like P-loop ATPase
MSSQPPKASLPHYRADQPVSDPSHDAYSRRAFADGLAKSIVSLPRDDCYVIGLHGPWGDGKTSVLRFVEHTLKEDPSTVVAWFNPWRFLHEEAMLSEFFGVLAASVKANLKTKGEKTAATIAKYGKWVGMLDNRAGKVADAAAVKAEATLEQLRERLRKELRALGKRIVVFIDDIDRLDSSEVASLFRLIKACADLPNVVYVLAFDREMVARTIGAKLVDGDAEAGRRFLEKIVQIPVALPPASRRDLDRTCMAGLDEVLQGVGLTLSDADTLRWQWAYQDGIARRLRTPRHVAQYLNAVRFAMPLLANEVNTVDLLLVEALRTCYATAYEIIRSNQGIVIGAPVGEIERRHRALPQDDLLAAAKQDMQKADADAMGRLVEAMFPRYLVSKDGFALGYESVKQWTRDRRVCSPAYGPRYFAYAIGSSDVADADIEAILRAAASDTTTQLRTLLDKQLETLKQTMLVFKLNERQTSIPGPSAVRIATMLATLGDRFDEPFSLQDRNHPGVEAALLAATLCRRIESEAERLQGARDILTHSKEMWFASAFMREADPPHPDPVKAPTLVADDSMKCLRTAFLARYNRHAMTGYPELDLERRWKFETLYRVARSGGRRLVHDRFVPNMRSDGNVAIRMLQLLAQPLARSGEIIPSPGDFGPEDLESLGLLVDVDEMAKVGMENWVPDHRRKGPEEWPQMQPDDRVLAQFWYYYENRKSHTQPDPMQPVLQPSLDA